MSLAHRIMQSIYGPFKPVPSPWSTGKRKRVRHGKLRVIIAYVNPTKDSLERAAETYFARKNWPMLTRCLKSLEIIYAKAN